METKIELTVYQAMTVRGALQNYDMTDPKYSIIKEIFDEIKDQVMEKATIDELNDIFPQMAVNVLLGKEPEFNGKTEN